MNLIWTAFWVSAALAFAGYLYLAYGSDVASQFMTGYLIEKSLSMDNLLVFSLIFSYFKTPQLQQGKYLSWGIIGAFILRGILIFSGAAILAQWHWVLNFFGLFLIFTAVKLCNQDDEPDVTNSKLIHWAQRYLPGFWMVVVAIELSDVLFALDSIPATFAVTQNPLVVYSSNLFAILGLRSLYFVLANALDRFEYLGKVGVPIVLAFIGLKILMSSWIAIPNALSLVITAVILGGSLLIKGEKASVEPLD